MMQDDNPSYWHLEEVKKMYAIDQIDLARSLMALQGIDLTKSLNGPRGITPMLARLKRGIATHEPITSSISNRLRYPQQSVIYSEQSEELQYFIKSIGFMRILQQAKEVLDGSIKDLQENPDYRAQHMLKQLGTPPKTTESKDNTLDNVKKQKIKLHRVNLLDFVNKATDQAIMVIPKTEIPCYEEVECKFCGSFCHVMEKCPTMLQKRFKTATQNRICMRCLEEGHTKEYCPSDIVCEECTGEHNTSFCTQEGDLAKIIGYVKVEWRNPCWYCHKQHMTMDCPWSHQSRRILVGIEKACEMCLSRSHPTESCKPFKTCTFCQGYHNILHCHAMEMEKRVKQSIEDSWRYPDQLKEVEEYRHQVRTQEMVELTQHIRTIQTPAMIEPCRYCNSAEHAAIYCEEDINVKALAVFVKNLCENCLSDQHHAETCTNTKVCIICNGEHVHSSCEHRKDPGTIKPAQLKIVFTKDTSESTNKLKIHPEEGKEQELQGEEIPEEVNIEKLSLDEQNTPKVARNERIKILSNESTISEEPKEGGSTTRTDQNQFDRSPNITINSPTSKSSRIPTALEYPETSQQDQGKQSYYSETKSQGIVGQSTQSRSTVPDKVLQKRSQQTSGHTNNPGSPGQDNTQA
ncbi:hypothetical protein CRE_16117 [Caenorhabditis remanei]|uniref:CCHC-type domain-containing protein n=1 Tax=Caenorhabditis remanei TaxID=31234 RepID=E3MBX5_CAERE|nr:hypothetical protein CRE_16117 [Caenorhabditis remanei]